jgi:hypothetical protein
MVAGVQMTSNLMPQALAIHVLAHMDAAADAVRAQDIEAVVVSLHDAVRLCEQYPRRAHDTANQLRDLLAFIRAVRSLCATLRRPDDDLRLLEETADALWRPLH